MLNEEKLPLHVDETNILQTNILTTATNQLILLKHFERRGVTSSKCLIAFQDCFQINT